MIFKRNNVRVFGKGTQPILFAHGFGCDQNMWRYITPAFENDFQLILFDYVGSGKSDLKAYNKERYSSLHGYAQDLLDICEELKLNDVILVAHSVSSMIGLLAAVEKPELFKNLILIGPSPCYINDLPSYKGGFERRDVEGLLETMDNNYIGWANFLVPIIMKNPEKPDLSKELEDSFCSTDPVIARNFAEVTFFSDNRRDLGLLKVPSLILQCSDDAIAPDEVGDYLLQHLKGSKLVKMKATGHCPHMSHPEETIRVIQEYLLVKA